MIQLHDSGVLFNKESHQYFLDGKQLQGITGMIHKRLFPTEYANIPQEVLDKAAARGSAIHEACEAYDNGEEFTTDYMDEVRAYEDLKAKKKLTHLRSEYLVTDGYHFASAIDKVFEVDESTVDLGDIKTTSALNKEYVGWQLSIYAYFFETMNPEVKVRNLYAIHIRDGKAKLVKVPRVPQEKILDLLADEVFDAPVKVQDTTLPSLPDQYKAMEHEIVEFINTIKELKAKEEELKARLLTEMDEAEVTKWQGDMLTFTRKADSSRETFDTKRFKAEQPDLYRQYTMITNTRGSVQITINK